MKIHRFYNHKEILYIEFKDNNIDIHGFQKFEGSLTETNGLCQLINNELLTVFSHEEKNYPISRIYQRNDSAEILSVPVAIRHKKSHN